MSPSVWWDNCVIYEIVEDIDEEARPPLKIWLDTGTNEPGWERARVLRDGLLEKGWRLHDDLHYFEAEGADHSEGAWGQRLDAVLRFLFPPPAADRSRAPRRRRETGRFRRCRLPSRADSCAYLPPNGRSAATETIGQGADPIQDGVHVLADLRAEIGERDLGRGHDEQDTEQDQVHQVDHGEGKNVP